MMTLQMDNNKTTTTTNSSLERVQAIFDKTVELEKKRQKAIQARAQFDPNLWQQIRENYEAIILEDHVFAEKRGIEFNLWQLHYKRIEEFRAHINAVLASTSSAAAAPNGKGPVRPDLIGKIKLQFRTYLSEATGFYHDLIMKIRSKYGLPLGYFSEEQESQSLADKDGKKLAEVRKGLVSCHRCLIYLGDLARYKGVFGDGDSKNRDREYAAASSYYLQAASLLPASGNPHHQLAIIASYSGDEFASTYRYFRSLAAESPFPTARDNLIVAFEKNRQSYAQLFVVAQDSSKKPPGKGRGKGEDISLKDANSVAAPEKDRVTIANEILRGFCIRFVRLNGILFTRTSLETFSDVLASTSSSLRELISSGVMEEVSFGVDTSDSALFIVRLVAVLVFSVHNSKKETEGQSYAEIVQRVEPARNSLTASFELLGHVVEKCAQLRDPLSSYFLPGVLVFVEWLACYPDIALGSDADDGQTAVRTIFWNQCVALLNQILSLGPMFVDDVEEESCFSNMSLYDERDSENRLALREDYELRGFLPLLPAQTILDFSRKHSFGSEGPKVKKARIKRILAAGKALTSVIKVGQNPVYFDSKKKKFLIGQKPSDDLLDSHLSPPEVNNALGDLQATMNLNSSVMQRDQQIYLGDEDDDDEVIVFRPLVTEKRNGASDQIYVPGGGFRNPDPVATVADVKTSSGFDTAFHENPLLQARDNANIQVPIHQPSLGYPHPSTQSQASAGSNHLGYPHPSTQSQALQQVQTQAVHPQPVQSLATSQLQPMQLQAGQLQTMQSQVGLLQQLQSQVEQLQSMQAQVGQPQPLQQLQSRAVHFQQTQAQVSHVSPAQSQCAPPGCSRGQWLPEEAASVAKSLPGYAQMSNGHVMRNEIQGNHPVSYYPAQSLPVHQAFNVNGLGGMPYPQSRTPEAMLPSKIAAVSSSGVITDGLGVQSSVARKNPISRGFRHLGPPPGFNSVPSKMPKEPTPGPDLSGNNLLADDYSWLDGYQAQSSRGAGVNNSLNYASSGKLDHMGTGNGLNGAAMFPFPGKEVSTSQVQANFPYFRNNQMNNFVNENHQSAQLPEQYQGQPGWSNRPFV